jgi:hypothetical protein
MPDYVTQAEVIAALPKLATNPELAELITDASDAVSLYTGRTFGLTTQTEAARRRQPAAALAPSDAGARRSRRSSSTARRSTTPTATAGRQPD